MKQQGRLKAPENEGQPSQEHAGETLDKAVSEGDDSVTDSLGNADVPVEISSADDHTQAEHKYPANEDANEAANDGVNEVVNEAANEDKDNGDLSQDKLINVKERINVQDSKPENNDPKTEGDSQVLDDNSNEETIEDNDEGVDDRTERTGVYTDPNGVQFDVKVENLALPDEGSDDDVEVIGVTEQELPRDGEDDPAEKEDDEKKVRRRIECLHLEKFGRAVQWGLSLLNTPTWWAPST